MSKTAEDVQAGQFWKSLDPRDYGRGLLKVESAHPQLGPGGSAKMRNTKTLRVSYISLRRFIPGSRGYRRINTRGA